MDGEMRAIKARVFELYDAGRTPEEAAATVGIHRLTAHTWHRQWKRKRRPWRSGESEPPASAEEPAQVSAAAGERTASPVLAPGAVLPARIYRTEVYGAFAEVLDADGNVTGRGLVHRSKMFGPGEAPKRWWVPDEFLPVGSETRVRILAAGDPQRLELSTAGLFLAPVPARNDTLLRLRGRHSPAVVIRALQAVIVALETVSSEVSVYVEITRSDGSDGDARHDA